MKRLSKRAASLVGETLTKLQFDGLSGYAYGGGQPFKLLH